MDGRATLASPGALHWSEHLGVSRHERILLRGAEFDHGARIVRITEGGKDFSSHAEIGMVHMGLLDAFGKRERQSPEGGRCHDDQNSTGRRSRTQQGRRDVLGLWLGKDQRVTLVARETERDCRNTALAGWPLLPRTLSMAGAGLSNARHRAGFEALARRNECLSWRGSCSG